MRISDWSSDVCSSDLFALITLVSGVLSHGYMMPFAVGSFGLGMMAGALSRPHDGSEVIATMIGVAVVALGHDPNRRARHCRVPRTGPVRGLRAPPKEPTLQNHVQSGRASWRTKGYREL